MWYTGEALYGFGHGLSYTNFSLDWTTGSAPGSVTVPVHSVVAEIPKVTFKVTVKNIGPVAGKETVMAHWSPPKSVDPLLIRQLFAFNGTMLEPGQSADLELSLPAAEAIATVTEDGNRVFYPGVYSVIVSRGNGGNLETTVTVGEGDPVTLSEFPSRWVDKQGITVDACIEGTTDVIAHTEDFLVDYKRWDFTPNQPTDVDNAVGVSTGLITHRASGKCLVYARSDDGDGTVHLANCSSADAVSEKWIWAAGAKTFSPSSAPDLCLTTAATKPDHLRIGVSVGGCAGPGASSQWSHAPDTGFIASGVTGLCLAARSEGVFNEGS